LKHIKEGFEEEIFSISKKYK